MYRDRVSAIKIYYYYYYIIIIFFLTLQALDADVKCSVRVNNAITEGSNVSMGLNRFVYYHYNYLTHSLMD